MFEKDYLEPIDDLCDKIKDKLLNDYQIDYDIDSQCNILPVFFERGSIWKIENKKVVFDTLKDLRFTFEWDEDNWTFIKCLVEVSQNQFEVITKSETTKYSKSWMLAIVGLYETMKEANKNTINAVRVMMSNTKKEVVYGTQDNDENDYLVIKIDNQLTFELDNSSLSVFGWSYVTQEPIRFKGLKMNEESFRALVAVVKGLTRQQEIIYWS